MYQNQISLYYHSKMRIFSLRDAILTLIEYIFIDSNAIYSKCWSIKSVENCEITFCGPIVVFERGRETKSVRSAAGDK